MAHLATKHFTYGGQLGILALFTGGGMLIGGIIASLVPLWGGITPSDLKDASASQLMDNLLKPENATIFRWITFVGAFFVFFLPPVLYALVCHKRPLVHLGFKPRIHLPSAAVAVLIMVAALPLVSALQEFTELLPWSKELLAKFKLAEETYSKQVSVIARMNDFPDYLISIVVIALFSAVFEETLFRGGMQNLFSRWFKKPILAIIFTSILFSAFHGSYLGFLSRFTLGFILGWMYYRTGNLWLNIIGHFFNNAFAVTVMFWTSRAGEKPNPAKLEENLPLWAAIISLVIVYALFVWFDRLSSKEIDHPGEELPMPGVAYTNNPFIDDSQGAEKESQLTTDGDKH